MTATEPLIDHELRRVAADWRLDLSKAELRRYAGLVAWLEEGVKELEALPSAGAQPIPARRVAGGPPKPVDDPLNAVVRRCSVYRPGANGPLAGMRVAIKDAIAVAGIPLTLGSGVLDCFVPNRDSVVVQRLIQAGAEIVASTVMDAFGCSGSGTTSSAGATLNPFDPGRVAGGSSGGAAACLSYPWIDASLGCDQAGSIRVPASWCGVLGLKPTSGLVPYSGIVGLDSSLDHVGPLATSTADLARLLGAVAGPNPSELRPRQAAPAADYARAVHKSPAELRGLRVAILREALAAAEDDVAEAVVAVGGRLHELGARVEVVSVPVHRWGGALAAGLYVESIAAHLEAGGHGYGEEGDYWPELAAAIGRGLRRGAATLPPSVKLTLLAGTLRRRRDGGVSYARARVLIATLREAYDRALTGADVLLLPTVPCLPYEYDPGEPLEEALRRGWSVFANTSQANMTGHPALTMPAAQVGRLPVGCQLIGRAFDEARLLEVAATWERVHGWVPLRDPVAA